MDIREATINLKSNDMENKKNDKLSRYPAAQLKINCSCELK